MKTLSKLFLLRNPLVFLLVGLFLSTAIQAQEDTNFVDLGVEFTNAPASVKINGVFGVTGRVFMEANSSSVPTSETLSVSIVLRDPNGIILDTHTQSWSGFTQSTDGTLKKSSGEQMLFQIPWSQSINWSASARWTLSAELTTSSIDENTGNDIATISFGLDVPDLRVSAETVSAVGPISGAESDDFVPNTNYTVSGSVTNFSNVPTQPGIYIPVTAQLVRVGENGDSQGVIDEETILLPQEDQFEMLFPNASWNFKIENLFLPPEESGNFAVLLRVNQQDIPGGPVQIESNYENNTDLHPDAPYINISTTSDVNDTNVIPVLKYIEGSYSGEQGTFRGLDPVYLSFAIRNSGNRPVASGDQISAKVLLSKDLNEDASDFILREFELGGSDKGGIGEGLLAGETINLTWFQQMPDNFEGDYYLMMSIDNVGDAEDELKSIESTPIITLSSQGAGTTTVLDTTIDGTAQPAERPDASKDGRFVTYEKTLLVNGEELQQIYIIDMEQPNPQPKLISRAYSSTSFFPIPANGNSFRPKISADGSTVVFYSSATNLVPGDTNNKEDVYLYRLSTDTMFRAVITSSNGSSTEQLNGRSLYPDVNGDGSRIVFESDSTNVSFSSGSQIFLWSLDANGGGTLNVITSGSGNSYNPSIDDAGKYIVFDSFASFTNDLNTTDGGADTNGLRDIFLMDVEDLSNTKLWRANLNYDKEQTEGGASLNPKISGDGSRIVYESKAQNLVTGSGIAKIEVLEGGYGYQGRPTVKIFEGDFNASGAYGRGAILSLKEDGINLLQEIKTDAILIIDSGEGYIKPRVEITHDPAYPAPLQEAKAIAYLSNPEGDVYYVDVGDVTGVNSSSYSFSQRISESSGSTGGNFASRDLSISYDGNAIVYSTKSSNLLPTEVVRNDGKIFYNSGYILPSAKAILVGGIGEIEIQSTGSGYTAGTLRIDDLSGTGSGAEASYRVDNRGRIVSIDILNPGQNYRLEQTIVSVSEPRGGSGFSVGTLRFEPTRGEGVDRRGGGRIYKVEMSEYGYGYKIGDDENTSFADIIEFEGDGADLNEDGFPDGRLNPDRVKNIGGSLFLEQRFDIEVLTLGEDLLNTTLSITDNNNSLEPLLIEFSDSAGGTASTITIDATMDRSQVRDEIIALIVDQMGDNLNGNADVERGPVIDSNLAGSSRFTFSALSGTFSSSNPSAIQVTELSNMLVMGSGYTTATPVINQVPNIFGFSETKSNPSIEFSEETGRVALLSEEDFESDDIYLYYADKGQNLRISTSSFGTPVGYRLNPPQFTTPLSNRFPAISGNGRYVFFSSDAWGDEGLAFSSSNQLPLVDDASRDIYFRDLKTNTTSVPVSKLDLLFPRNGVNPFAPNSSVPVIADLNHTGSVDRVTMILNQTDLDQTQGPMELFLGGGVGSNFNSGRYTSMIRNLESGEYSLQLVAYGSNQQVIATSALIRFSVSNFEGSLPPFVSMSNPRDFDAITSTSVIPLTARAEDPDGAVVAVQYYVDGETYLDEIKRVEGISEGSQAYPTLLKLSEVGATQEGRGVRSIFVIGWDNSGNYVSSDVYNISFTQGMDEAPQISFNSGTMGFEINASDLTITFDSQNGITSISSNGGPIGEGLIDARIDISGKGSGAEIRPLIELDTSSSNYGKLIGLEVVKPGLGYDSNTTLKCVPILRAINTGIPAGLSYSRGQRESFSEASRTDTLTIATNVDGSKRVGSGYAMAPRLRFRPGGGGGRLQLLDTNEPTSSIFDFGSISYQLAFNDPRSGAYVEGGFGQAPIFFEINATSSGEKIESVSLVIDGETSEEYTKSESSRDSIYSFYWIPEIVRDYSISGIVRDVAGNVVSTPETTVSVKDYLGGGLNLEVLGDSNFSIESNGQLLLTAIATSQFGISEVEFYINDQSVGIDYGTGGNFFQSFIDINKTGLRQGEHSISVVARDNAGNQAGTFPRFLTNINSRKNRILKVLPPIIRNPPSITFDSPPSGMSIPLGSSLRLVANASDPNGDLKSVQFYANQETVYSWSGILEFDGSNLPADNSLLTIDDGSGGAYTFEFNSDSSVEPGDTPKLVPAYGNHLNDLTLSGNFDFPDPLNFVIEIDGVSNGTDTYKWSTDGGFTFVEEKQLIESITVPSSLGEFGLQILFSKSSGHHLGDRWSFYAQPKNHIINISDTKVPAIDGKRTKLRLYHAIHELYKLRELSIYPQVNDYDDTIYLRHINDLTISNDVSLSGDSLNYLNYHTDDDDMILATIADSTLPQPFGSTWMPSTTGSFVIFALAEDSFGNRVSSSAVVVTVSDAEGKTPVVELNAVSSPISFSGGGSISQTLTAEGYDPDGSIAMVDFYSNAELVGSDNTRPYQVSFDLNATGHYELYAVARDNEGNVVTSNVEYLIIDAGGAAPKQALEVENNEIFSGSLLSVSSNYKSPIGPNSYDDNIRAMVLINGLYEGDATKIPRTPPLLGQEDPGQSFIFEKQTSGVGDYEIEFIILNGEETSSATATIIVSESPLTDDYLFLQNLWNGLFDRDPEPFEISNFLLRLEVGSITRAQIAEELHQLAEFVKARNLLLVYKTTYGSWASSMNQALGMSTEINQNEQTDQTVRPDDGDSLFTATTVSMNETIRGEIETPGDIDIFKIISSGDSRNDGILSITLEEGHPGVGVNNWFEALDISTFGLHAVKDDGSEDLEIGGSFGTENARFRESGFDRSDGQQFIYSLKSFQLVDYDYYILVHGSPYRTGSYNLTFLNPEASENEIGNAMRQLESKVLDANIMTIITNISNGFEYSNQYGQIETHDPESFFNRLFRNKYEQDPSPTQSARGVNLLKDGRSQLQFLQDFALENNVITVGGYNYTTSEAQLAIPNVPLDAAAFADTALVYSALMGEAPSNDQVALLTMTPRMEVRPLSQRAELILDMPEYAKQYGVAKPEIDFIGIQNGQSFSGGEQISVEASSLGVDDLGGTVDDGEIHTVELFLNGKSLGLMTEPATGEFFYTHSLASTFTAGEYQLEVVAEDVNGLMSRAQRMIRITSNQTMELEITSPSLGTTLEVGDTVEVNFSQNGSTNITNSFLEINGKVQWSAVLSLDGLETPRDEHNFSIDDGTGRGAVFFEFDSDGLASETVIENPENIIGTEGLVSTGEYIGVESREYLIEIDNDNEPTPISRTFRWSIDGGVNFNQTGKTVDFNQSHFLSSGIEIEFNSSKPVVLSDVEPTYNLGDRWRIKAYPLNEIIEVGNQGTVQDRVEKTRQNIIQAINRARNEGKLAIYAEDPYSKGIYKGSLPEQYIQPNSIILHHDASYPAVEDIAVDIASGVPLSSTTCMDKVSSDGTSLSLFLGGCLEMPDPLVSLRIIGSDSNGNLYYSSEKVYPVRNPDDTYAKMIKMGDVFNPGRLPTIVVSEVNSSTGAISGVEILDAGNGYRELVSESHDLSVVSSSGMGAKLRAEISATGSVDDVVSSFMGTNYRVGDTISPSPSAVFEMGVPISLDARLIGPKSQIDRVAFYANGVEIEGNVSEMIGGYYGTVFTPSDPGDYFISVRALYGDSRDSGSFGQPKAMHANIAFMDNQLNGWQNLWSQQSVSGSSLITPVWFWQHADYWDPDLSWRQRTHWNDAAPLRVIETQGIEIQITINSASSAVRAVDLLNLQRAQINADIVRASKNSPQLTKAYLYGNETVLVELDIEETNKTSYSIPIEWEVSLLELGNSAYFTVVGEDGSGMKYFSDPVTLSIRSIDIDDDAPSAVAMMYHDLSGVNPSPEEVEVLRQLVVNDTKIEHVIGSILSYNPTILESQIDLLAVQHILFGDFFESFEEFLLISEEWTGPLTADSSDETLKRFIDNQLLSDRYNKKYRGGVPHLVGAPTSNRLVSYKENRDLFVKRHFSSKYGRSPSTLQLKQASRRMLDYWSNNHETGYWELLASAPQATNEDTFSGSRRDTELSRRPDREGPNGEILPGAYYSGECAVDFIYELAKEFVYPRNQAYLSYISSFALRDSLYRPAALLYSLVREEINVAEKTILEQAQELQGLSIDEVLRRITDRSRTRFNRRFNFIFHEQSPEVSLLAADTSNTFWKSIPWFGTFMDKEYPWIYHVDLGWLYSKGTDTENIWFYSDSLKVQGEEIGWFWTNKYIFEGPTVAGNEYEDHRFIFVVRQSSSGSKEGSWALLNISNGQVRPYGWLPLGK